MFENFLKSTFLTISAEVVSKKMIQKMLWILFICILFLPYHSAGMKSDAFHTGDLSGDLSGGLSDCNPSLQYSPDLTISHEIVPARTLATCHNASALTQNETTEMQDASATAREATSVVIRNAAAPMQEATAVVVHNAAAAMQDATAAAQNAIDPAIYFDNTFGKLFSSNKTRGMTWAHSVSGETEKTSFETTNKEEEQLEDTLFVREFVLALDVIEREPVDIVTSYRMPDARAWCFARIHNSEKMQDLYFEWYYEDTLYFEMSTKTGLSNNWRTYSSVGLQPGTWRVLLKNSNGKVLEEIQFLVSE